MRNELQAAVEYFKSLLQTIADDEWNREARNSAKAALSALRDALKREEGCDTCRKGKAHFGDVLWAINKDGNAVININGEQANTVFPYCPMCGRYLADRQRKEARHEE